jgi:transposase
VVPKQVGAWAGLLSPDSDGHICPSYHLFMQYLTGALAGAAAIELLDTLPGVGRGTAELLVAEVGTDMRRFPSAAHLASWAKVCPGNRESGGKRYSGRTGSGNRWLRGVLIQAAHAAVKVKDCYFARLYRRLAGRRGTKRAIMAVAHRLLLAAYYMLRDHEPYREPIAGEGDAQRTEKTLQRLRRRMEQLGYQVRLEPLPAAVA